jgi:hypothetical protein
MTEIGEAAGAGGTGDSPAEVDPVLVSVQILDGGDKKVLTADRRQFVNLPRDAKWVDAANGPKTEDRLDIKVRVLVTFSKPGAHSFKLRLIPDPTNVAYTGAEKGRNPKFKYQDQDKSYTTEADGTKIVPMDDVFIDVAGKHLFVFEGEDGKANKVQSDSLEVVRFIYLQELKMTGAAAATTLGTLVAEFTGNGLVVSPLPSATMTRVENVSNSATDTSTFQTAARTAYAGSTAPSKQPYVVAVAYTDHLAVKDASQTVAKAGIVVGPTAPVPKVKIPIVDASGGAKYLWKNIVTGEGWFVSASYDDGAGGTPVAIDEAKCVAVPIATTVPDMCREVEVDVSGLTDGTGKITLVVNWVNRMRGGLSFPGGNLIVVCTRAWWQTKDTTSQNQTMVHELGHTVGMVSPGTGKLPDKPAKHYTGRGHIGDHCHQGIALAATFSSTTGTTCVMFGATNGVSAFCSDCAPVVQKVDVSDGWSAF